LNSIRDIVDLEDRLSEPSDHLVDVCGRLEGDILVLGAGGKMGPSLARMALRASLDAGIQRRVIAVSRFGDAAVQSELGAWGVETIRGDLLDERFVASLPDVPNIVNLVGFKFGSSDATGKLWATNTYLPAIVCRRFSDSRIVALSTGNVYGMIPVAGHRSSVESDPPRPAGEYAMSCLGRERIYQYFSQKSGTQTSLIRLNYAAEMRYGVLVDLAQQVYREQPISLTVGSANVIWQADASAHVLCALEHASSPPFLLNVTGPERVCCREVCERFGQLTNKRVKFSDSEGPVALLSDATRAFELFGKPRVSLDCLIKWTADWIVRENPTANKPTHFEVTDGEF